MGLSCVKINDMRDQKSRKHNGPYTMYVTNAFVYTNLFITIVEKKSISVFLSVYLSVCQFVGLCLIVCLSVNKKMSDKTGFGRSR